MTSPTKLYHDFVVFPLYTYILASAGIPVVWKSSGGWNPRLVGLLIVLVFAGLVVYDQVHFPSRPGINYDWRTMTPG
jgi:hypothetical protein